ncbi:Has a role in transcriptional regulation [Blomia tropicalis]|nr:Has a role in transcriptional regulation [Blomia tropicalis]
MMQNGTSGTAIIAQRERDRQRERERTKRAAVALQTTVPGMTGVELTATSGTLQECGKPSVYFGDPIYTGGDEDDDTVRKIKSVLGEFSDFANQVVSKPSMKPSIIDHPPLNVEIMSNSLNTVTTLTTTNTVSNMTNTTSTITSNTGNHISSREVNRRKVEQIFSEMKNPIEPLTGLDDLEDHTNPIDHHHQLTDASSNNKKRKITPTNVPQPPTSSTISANKSVKLSQSEASSSDSDDDDVSSSNEDDDSEDESNSSSSESSKSSNSDDEVHDSDRSKNSFNKPKGKTKTDKARKFDTKMDSLEIDDHDEPIVSNVLTPQSNKSSNNGMNGSEVSECPIPSSAGLGPPTNNINDNWDLDNFVELADKKTIYSNDTQPIESTGSSKRSTNLHGKNSSSRKGKTDQRHRIEKGSEKLKNNRNSKSKYHHRSSDIEEDLKSCNTSTMFGKSSNLSKYTIPKADKTRKAGRRPSPHSASNESTSHLSPPRGSKSLSITANNSKQRRSATPTKLSTNHKSTPSNQRYSSATKSAIADALFDDPPHKSSKSTKFSNVKDRDSCSQTTKSILKSEDNLRTKVKSLKSEPESLLVNNQENIDHQSLAKGKSNKRSNASTNQEMNEPKKKNMINSETNHCSKQLNFDSVDSKSNGNLDNNFIVSLNIKRLNRVPCVDRNGNFNSTTSTNNSNQNFTSFPNNKKESKKASIESNKSQPSSNNDKATNKSEKNVSSSSKKKKDQSSTYSEPKTLLVNIPLGTKKSSTNGTISNTIANINERLNKKSSVQLKEEPTDHQFVRDYHSRLSSTPPSTSNTNHKSSPMVKATTNSSSSSVASPSNSLKITNLFSPMSSGEARNKARSLKRIADREQDRYQQMSHYIESVIYFIQCGQQLEREQKRESDSTDQSLVMYKETLTLLRSITLKFTKSSLVRIGSNGQPEYTSTDIKLIVFAHRCQVLLMLRIARMRSKEIHDNKEMINAYLSDSSIQPFLLNQTSRDSTQPLSIPTNTLQIFSRQINLLQNYQFAIDLWTKAEAMIEKNSNCKDYFQQLSNSDVGHLTLSSPFDHLINYTLNGIKNLNLSSSGTIMTPIT